MDGSEAANRKNEWTDEKTRTLRQRKGATPEIQNQSKTRPVFSDKDAQNHAKS
jgi:hypothetical protein